jgi:hypothetical protein
MSPVVKVRDRASPNRALDVLALVTADLRRVDEPQVRSRRDDRRLSRDAATCVAAVHARVLALLP